MQKKKRSQWRKLDNAAQAFPAATGKKDTRVFRLYCELKEDVIEEVLQKAVECTLEKYPLYCSVLRKGLFWFYMEQRNLKPKVKAEDRPPCSGLYVPDQKSFLFEVSYYKKKINLEVFHCLTDGTGALNFLKELVRNYLMICYPQVEFPPVSEEEISTSSDHEEDSFSQYYSKSDYGSVKKSRPAFQLKGERLEQEEMSVLEVVLSAKEVYRKAKSYGVSVTVFLSAALLCAIHEEMPRSQMKKPVTLMVPVNLRNYFPSYSMTNFFGWIEAGQVFEENTRFEEVLQNLQHVFRTELVKERIADNMNRLVRLEKNPLLRAVPLEIKNLFLLAGTTLGGRSISAIYSNIGKIQLPDVFETYVGLPVMIAAPSVLTKYGGKLKLSNAVVVGISQSGAAQDVCSLIDRGNRDGSLTVAITNTEGSLLSQRAKFHLNCCAGLEKSLAATKTFLCQLALLTQLAAQLSGEPRLLDLVKRLPRIAAAMLDRTQELSRMAHRYRFMNECFILARGLNYPIALEFGIKTQETSFVRSRAYSVANFTHGPIAMLRDFIPVFVLATDSATDENTCEIIKRLKNQRCDVCVITNKQEIADLAGGNAVLLPPECEGVAGGFACATVIQLFACELSVQRGNNPDAPEGLTKVTVTV